jgi:hypothetical protein
MNVNMSRSLFERLWGDSPWSLENQTLHLCKIILNKCNKNHGKI